MPASSRQKRATVSVLESEMGAVQGDDLSNGVPEPVNAHREPEQAPMVVLPHPLEMAPINSKIVVTADGAVLAMPESESVTLVRPDPAARLPVGAKISKTRSIEGETFYVATLLNSERPEEPSIHGSALEAILEFPEIHYNR